MFTHRIKIQLKRNTFIELSGKIQTEIMPWLRRQKGFCHGVTTIDTQWSTATEDTFWETRKAAEDYDADGFSEIKKILAAIGADAPAVSIFEDSASALIEIRELPETIKV